MPLLTPLLRLALLLAVSLCAAAQPRPLAEGEQYELILPPMPTESAPDRIEVTEVFWYGCPRCAELEPMMTSWRDGIAGDLDFRRSPAVWNEVMETHARIYYAAEALDLLGRAHREAFRAVHEEGNPLASEEQARTFFERFGVKREAFSQAWNSGEVTAKVNAARISTAGYGIEKLPSLIVNGTYRVAQNAFVPSHVDMVVAVNLLVRNVRSTRRIDVGGQ